MKIKSTTFLLLSPWVVTFLIFWFFPLLYSFYLSFTDFSILNPQSDWIGLANYLKLFSDSLFWQALKNTFIFVFGTIPVTTVIALFLALLVNQKIPFKNIFRAGFFLPSITSMVVMALIFTQLYAQNGYISFLCKLAGVPVPQNGFLFSTKTSLLSIMAMDIWISSGYYMLLFLAALQAIPVEVYESANSFGANFWQKTRYITLPYLRPMFLLVIVINAIRSFQIFVEIFVMTKGGPLNSTLTMVYLVYDKAFSQFQMGYASAIAYVLFLIILVFSILQTKIFKLEKGIGD